MIRAIAPFAMVLTPATALAQGGTLSLEHQMLLRCSAAFATVAAQQAAGQNSALAYPPLADHGRAFFVRASAKVMEEAGLDRNGVAEALMLEARELTDHATLAQVMPVCLTLLPPHASTSE